MEFENIKTAMDNEAQKGGEAMGNTIPKKSALPLEVIRKRMKMEIVTQLLCMIAFFAFPLLYPMGELSRPVYLIFMTITCVMTAGYLIRMAQFLKRSSIMSGSTQSVLQKLLSELNVTLAVYKTAIVAGSSLLPISMLALMLGRSGREEAFRKLFLLQLSPTMLIGVLVSYLLVILVFVWITHKWAEGLYGEPKQELELHLAELSETSLYQG